MTFEGHYSKFDSNSECSTPFLFTFHSMLLDHAAKQLNYYCPFDFNLKFVNYSSQYFELYTSHCSLLHYSISSDYFRYLVHRLLSKYYLDFYQINYLLSKINSMFNCLNFFLQHIIAH